MSHVLDAKDPDAYRVEIWMKGGGTPHIYEAAVTYAKGGFYCVYERDKDMVTKWPMADIYRTIEEYKRSARRSA